MPVYRITPTAIEPLQATTFQAQGLKERDDLQRLLRSNIAVLGDDLLVIDEEFRDWQDSRRRVDLLCIDRAANLVVVELKRDDDGGHMELQAIRYAAMVSTMTFAHAAARLQSHLDRTGAGGSGEAQLLEFLGWEEPNEDDFGRDVRIILVAADFSKEITTAVLWLNKRDLDIRCIRLKPYIGGNGTRETLVDVQQVIPIPEAEAYTIQMREKEQAVRADTSSRHGLRLAMWTVLLPDLKQATGRFTNWNPGEFGYMSSGTGVEGARWHAWMQQHKIGAELYIDAGPDMQEQNKAFFDALIKHRDQIERTFGGHIDWDRIDEKRACRIYATAIDIGYRDDPSKWPAAAAKLGERFRRFMDAFQPHLPGAAEAAASISASAE